MAICTFGPTVVGIRGTIGGITFSQSKSGPYCKAWSRGATQQGLLQDLIRGQLASMGTPWTAMSDAQRLAWDTFAATPNEYDYNAFGQQYWLSGYSWYVRCGIRRRLVNLAVSSTPPSGAAATSVSGLTLELHPTTATNSYLSWTAGTFAATDSLFAFLSICPSAGNVKPNQPMRLLIPLYNPGNGPLNITPYLQFLNMEVPIGYKGFLNAYKQALYGNRSVVAQVSDVSS
jgi:hypothetical protein